MKRLLAILMVVSVLFSIGCVANADYLTLDEKFTPDKNGVYKDLGNYLIELNYEEADFEAARAYLDKKLGLSDAAEPFDDTPVKVDPVAAYGSGACTTCSKLNKDGEVLIGRNMDNEISVCPAYIIHTSFGKYPTVSVRFNNYDTYTYEEFKEKGYKDADYMNYIPFCVGDAMNSEGLYVEANVREPDEYFLNSGTNPGKERVTFTMLVQLIAMNCATVKEALDYLKNDLNIVSSPYFDMRTPTQFAYCIGDATGTYGVIEIARNEVHFVPYASAQGNYYLNPVWTVMDANGSGYGRAERVMDGLEDVNTLEEMMEHMKKPMWSQDILYYENTYQDEDGITRFVDDEGNPVIDWRSDLANILPVDPETGHITTDPDAGEDLFVNSTVRWMMNEDNFEEMKAGIEALMKMLGWKEKLEAYYEGDELPLREEQGIFTTGVSYAVNCNQKTMLVKFWEKEDLTFEIKLG